MHQFFIFFCCCALLLVGARASEEEEEQYGDESRWGICYGPFLYGNGHCDCGCQPGTRDIDCDVSGSNPAHQDFKFGIACPLPPPGHRNMWCNDIGVCELCEDCGVWTCDPGLYNDGTCHCDCGILDPDCNVDQFGAQRCFGTQICTQYGACSYCGNGQIDTTQGEVCDRKSGCCSEDCQTALADNIDCNGGNGFCSSGVCRTPTPIEDIHVAKDAQGNPIRTSTSITLEWELVNESNPQVDKFCIEKNEKVNGEWTGWVISNPNVSGTKRMKEVGQLNPGTVYKFRIQSKLGPEPKLSAWEATWGISTLA